MRSEWYTVKLGDVTLKIGSGSTPRGGSNVYLESGTYALFRSQNILNNAFGKNGLVYINEEAAKKLQNVSIEESDVLLNITGDSVARVCKAPVEYLPARVNQHVAIIRTKPSELDSSYLNYYLNSQPMQNYMLSLASAGATRNALTKVMIENFEITMPPLPTQKKIAHILSTLDDKIELNRKMNQTLEEMAQALFKSWFVDFDPVHARLTCKSDQELETASRELGISKEVLELFPSKFEESELGMIPEEWRIAKIEEILKRYKAPKRYKKDAVKSYGRTVVLEQGADIILGYHDHNGEFEATVSEPMFIFGDHTCVMKLSTKPFSISENVIPLSGCVRNGYWTYYATYGQQTFQEYRRHWSELIVRDIVLADEAICDFFAEQVQSLILKIEQNISENDELIMTRDTLLPKLLSGELDVSDLEI